MIKTILYNAFVKRRIKEEERSLWGQAGGGGLIGGGAGWSPGHSLSKGGTPLRPQGQALSGEEAQPGLLLYRGREMKIISFSLIIKEESFNQKKKHHMMHLRALYKPQ